MDTSRPFMNLNRLIIMRHAHAMAKKGNQDDWSRLLSEKGVAEAQVVAKKMQENSYLPKLAVISDSLRTTQTWSTLQTLWKIETPHYFNRQLYSASLEQLLTFLEDFSSQLSEDKVSLMILGHNPGLEELAQFLLNDPAISMNTAAVIVLVSQENSWRQESFLTP